MNPTIQNCTLMGGNVSLIQISTTTWTLKDNLFDGTANYMEGTITHNYNGYTTNVTRLTPNGANDVVLTVTNKGQGAALTVTASCRWMAMATALPTISKTSTAMARRMPGS